MKLPRFKIWTYNWDMLATNLILYLAAFFIIWVGSGLIIKSIDRVTKKIRLSSFAISFFLLGLMTSAPEFSVGLTAINEGRPEIFVGNLLGGTVALFLLVIPFLAIAGNGIKLKTQISKNNLLLAFAVILFPAILIIDKKISGGEIIFMFALYGVLFYFIEIKKGLMDKKRQSLFRMTYFSLFDLGKVSLGIALLFLASQIIVEKTIFFADMLGVSALYVSFIFLPIGTNLPEIFLGLRSIVMKRKDVAFGNYIGSASANTLLLGVLSLTNGGRVTTENNFIFALVAVLLGVSFFYLFTRKDDTLSRREGYVFLVFYAVFILAEETARREIW